MRNRTYLCMQPTRQYAPRSSRERAVRAVLRDCRCSGTLRGRSTRAIRRPRRQVCRRRRPPRRCCRARSIAAPIRSAWRAAKKSFYTRRHVHAHTRHDARTRRRSPTDRTKTTGDGLNTSWQCTPHVHSRPRRWQRKPRRPERTQGQVHRLVQQPYAKPC